MGRTTAVLLWLAPLLVASGWLLVAFGAPSDGTVTARRGDGWSRQAITLDEAFAEGTPLRPEDRLIAVDHIPIEQLITHPGSLRVHDGQVLTYTVLRPAGDLRSGRPDGPAQGPWEQHDLQVRLGRFPLADGLDHHLTVVLLALTMYLISSFVVVRRPGQPAARALYLIASTIPVTVSAFPFSPQAIDLVTGRLWPFVVADLGNCLIWGALLHFALVFPGPLPWLARHPRLAVVPYLLPPAYQLLRVVVSLPTTQGDPLARLQILMVTSQWAAFVQPFLVATALALGYRSAADGLVRRRMRWSFVAVTVAVVFYLALGQIPSRLVGHPLVAWDWLVVLFLPFPVGIALTVLRYRLFDIQIILRRSLVLGAVTVGLGTLYLVTVAAASRYTRLPSAFAPFAASLVVAVIFGPLRTYAHRLVSRSLFGDRDDPYEVMNRLGQRLAATSSADSVLVTLVETLAETLRLSYASIRLDGTDHPIAYGVRAGLSIQVPIRHGGEQVGELEIDPGPRREPFGLADQRLLDGLARQVGVISQNLLLEMRLRQSLERLVTTREEERRRLRRDLHDGLGPALATTAMQVELAAMLIDRDPQRAKEILAGLGAAQRDAVADLRRLVDGLRPPVLDRLGLVGALRDGADGFCQGPDALIVTVRAEPDLEPLPAAVEVAAYRLAQEALTNTARHARAGRCDVRLWREAGALLVQVTDDGVGLPTGYRAGVGINAIRERATELGGSASVTPGPGGGTVVFARLPVRAGLQLGPAADVG